MTKVPTYKNRVWVANTWSAGYHCKPEARCYLNGGQCTCIRCLIEKTMMQDPLAGPAFFKDGEEKLACLVGLYLRLDD